MNNQSPTETAAEEERSLQCSFIHATGKRCNASFIRLHDYERHCRIHTGDKLMCEYCQQAITDWEQRGCIGKRPKQFRTVQKGNLNNHIRSKHPEAEFKPVKRRGPNKIKATALKGRTSRAVNSKDSTSRLSPLLFPLLPSVEVSEGTYERTSRPMGRIPPARISRSYSPVYGAGSWSPQLLNSPYSFSLRRGHSAGLTDSPYTAWSEPSSMSTPNSIPTTPFSTAAQQSSLPPCTICFHKFCICPLATSEQGTSPYVFENMSSTSMGALPSGGTGTWSQSANSGDLFDNFAGSDNQHTAYSPAQPVPGFFPDNAQGSASYFPTLPSSFGGDTNLFMSSAEIGIMHQIDNRTPLQLTFPTAPDNELGLQLLSSVSSAGYPMGYNSQYTAQETRQPFVQSDFSAYMAPADFGGSSVDAL